MPQVAIPIAVAAAGSAVTAGVSAGIASGVSAGISAGLWAGVVGAAVGALGILIKPKAPRSRRNTNDIEVSEASRLLPVPVGFGRFRSWGNFVSVGGFGGLHDRLKSDIPGRRLRRIHAMLGIAEGPLQWATNFMMDGKTMKEWMRAEDVTVGDSYAKYWIGDEAIKLLPGTTSEDIDTMVADAASKMPDPKIPWRRLGKLKLHCIVGDVPKLPSISGDFAAPDYKISTTDASGNIVDTPTSSTHFGYDAFAEEWWESIPANGYMIHMQRRQSEAGVFEYDTFFPTGVNIAHAWYFGRHDIVLLQDDTDRQKFWFGYRGIAGDSTDWEGVRVDPQLGYANNILLWYVDELHQVLHTLHNDGTVRYVQRFWPLTGRVERVNLSVSATTWRAMMYSPDMDAYLIVGDSTLFIVDPVSGATRLSPTPTGASSTIALCVSGSRVGLIANGSMVYYDPVFGTTETGFGTAGGGLTTPGDLGGTVVASQNSWTYHVSLKKSAGNVSFLPSVKEDVEDVSCVGTPGGVEDQDFLTSTSPFYLGTNADAFTRDWSYCTNAGGVTLTHFQGRSSLAQAFWASAVEETALQNGRWGGGFNKRLVSRSSVEALHGYCVGGIRYTKPDGVTHRYAERAKFDYLLNQKMQLSSFLSDEILACVNAARAVYDGKLHVVIPRRGLLPQWHFSDAQTKDSQMTLAFAGKVGGINKVSVQFVNVRDDYRNDFAEASNDFHQTVTGRTVIENVALQGISRFNHAEWLAKTILDQNSYMRRQVEFTTNGYAGWLVVPGDGIEVTHTGTGLRRVLFRVTSVTETEDGDLKITALEHKRMLESVRGTTLGNTPGVDDPDDGDDPDGSDPETGPGPLGGDAFWFANGAIFEAGTYRMDYQYGAWKPNGGGWTGYTQYGYDIITRVSGVQVILGDTPGINIASPGYADIDTCETANAGQTTTFTLTTAGKIGIKIKPAWAPFVNFPQPRPRPTFALYPA